MSLPSEIDSTEQHSEKPLCTQAGYLPVPLRAVPPESLNQLNIYLAKEENYSLYRSQDLHFSNQDIHRLLDSGVEFVYVSVQDHQAYYRTMETAIQTIVTNPKLRKEKKAEILYATSLELANQLLSSPPQKEELERAGNISRATVHLILDDHDAFSHLFETFNHDFYTATHMVNVCSISIALAQKLGFITPDLLPQLGTGCLLHDVGKIFIPNEILNSEDPLSSSQFTLVRSHVERGCQHLTSVCDLPEEVMAVVSEHHERIDGSGYPKGLKRDQISPLGRLAGIVDTFDAMTSVRPYRDRTHSIAQSLEYITSNAGEKFDPDIVNAFVTLIEQAIRNNGNSEETDQTELSFKPPASSDSSVSLQTQYYFRIPITVRRIKQIHGRLALGPEEKLIAHKISRTGIGLLSSRPIPLDQNIYLSAPQFEQIALDPLLAIVTSCRDHGDGWFTIEAQFHKHHPAELIDKLKSVINLREVTSNANP
jgi:HD-GYP domain-containing protein (c-di-GMP phosphodiesterase class II)